MKMPKNARQEWKVFKALCPRELMTIVKRKKVSHFSYENIINLMEDLRFYELAMWFLIEKKVVAYERTKKTEQFLRHLTQGKTYDYCERNLYTKIFIDNIENEFLKKYFSEIT